MINIAVGRPTAFLSQKGVVKFEGHQKLLARSRELCESIENRVEEMREMIGDDNREDDEE